MHAVLYSEPATAETVHELLVRIGAKVCGALPTGGRLHPLGGGALAVVPVGCGANAARQWVDSLRTDLTEHWSELAGDLPAAEFRLAFGHQVDNQGVEALIGDLRNSLPRPRAEGALPAGGGLITQPMPVIRFTDDDYPGHGALDGVESGRSLRDQWAAAGVLDKRAMADVQVAERSEREPATTPPEPRIGELTFAELLADALDAYRAD